MYFNIFFTPVFFNVSVDFTQTCQYRHHLERSAGSGSGLPWQQHGYHLALMSFHWLHPRSNFFTDVCLPTDDARSYLRIDDVTSGICRWSSTDMFDMSDNNVRSFSLSRDTVWPRLPQALYRVVVWSEIDVLPVWAFTAGREWYTEISAALISCICIVADEMSGKNQLLFCIVIIISTTSGYRVAFYEKQDK